VSADGATTGFPADVGRFYELASRVPEDVTLTGADTILAQEEALAAARPGPGPARDGPVLAVVDSRARVTSWTALRDAGHWRDVVALRSRSTPPSRAGGPRELVRGAVQVDLPAALAALAAEGARAVRVDSGGGLLGALLDAGLVDEVDLLVHPYVVGSGPRRWTGAARATALDLVEVESAGGGLVLLRYRAAAAWEPG
jgi:2,5-diamino-6-(ribosylamino)-4(3H)-pyrimidinone 5'-phosphate reductase